MGPSITHHRCPEDRTNSRELPRHRAKWIWSLALCPDCLGIVIHTMDISSGVFTSALNSRISSCLIRSHVEFWRSSLYIIVTISFEFVCSVLGCSISAFAYHIVIDSDPKHDV